MEELLDVYTKKISEMYSMNEITKKVHNGYRYEVVKGENYDIIFSNELGTDNYRVSVKFVQSKKVFYIDLLMRNDNYQLPDINIPLSTQFNYIKDRMNKIVEESWCEEMMKKYDYNENDFIKKMNTLRK